MSAIMVYRLTVIGLLLICAGCGGLNTVQHDRDSDGAPVIEVPPYLTSELRPDSEGKVRILIPMSITNEAAESRKLLFEGTACSCFGLNYQGVQVAKGATYTIASGETLAFEVETRPAPVARELELRAFFAWIVAGEQERFSRAAHLRVLADASVSQLVSLNVDFTELSHPLVHHLEIERVARKLDLVAVVPELKTRAPYVSLKSAAATNAPEEISSGLWKQTWGIDLEIIPPADLTQDQLPTSLDFHFGTEPVVAKTQLLLTLRTPLHYSASLQLGSIPAGTEKMQKLLVQSSTKTSFLLTRSELSDANVTMRGVTERKSEQMPDIGYTPTQSGPFQATAVLDTDVPDLPQITIHLTGTAYDPNEQEAQGEPASDEAADK